MTDRVDTAKQQLSGWASQHSNVTPLDGTDRDSPTFGDLRLILEALNSTEGLREALVEAQLAIPVLRNLLKHAVGEGIGTTRCDELLAKIDAALSKSTDDAK